MNKTSEKTKRIIYWVLTGLVAFVFLGSAAGKLSANEEALKMAAGFGLDAKTYTMLGIVELISIILFIIPRTGIVGTLLLAAYMGGAIASHLEHGVSIVAPCIVQTFMFLVAFYRFPELRSKLLNSK
ncbi:MAG: DoxX family protein [Chitinophagaceae bacterium]|jgi:DoxX-like family|nr:DoxX family protein [Chitinophagaceae bacterium]